VCHLDGTANRAEGGNGDAGIDRDLIRAGLDGDVDGLGGGPGPSLAVRLADQGLDRG